MRQLSIKQGIAEFAKHKISIVFWTTQSVVTSNNQAIICQYGSTFACSIMNKAGNTISRFNVR